MQLNELKMQLESQQCRQTFPSAALLLKDQEVSLFYVQDSAASEKAWGDFHAMEEI